MRRSVRFLLGHEPRQLRDVDPTQTVLEWLRGTEHRKGTKEGCAEGDCGACTVVVARPHGDGLRYEAVNSCIQFVPTLDGCQLLTVEDLKQPDGSLHPVQQAMVEANASQCGFCTPGFVMSLFAFARQGGEPTPERVADALSGNLCRCTGYGPILAAAAVAAVLLANDHIEAGAAATRDTLTGWADGETVAIEHDGRRYLAPATVDALADILLEHPDATVLAGSTDVGLWVTKQHRVLPTVVHIGRIAELKRIDARDGEIEIGAGVSCTDGMQALADEWPDMGETYRRYASPPIRNAATIGGNIANGSPIGDSPPMLIAAGATLVLRRGRDRRQMPLEDFFIAYGKQDRRPGEFVESVIVPRRKPAERFRAYKISKRFDQDISAVMAAFKVTLDGGRVASARIAYGGMAGTPKRASAAEAVLTGQPWRRETVDQAMQALERDFTPLTDMRASAAYRMKVAQNLLLKCFLETSGPDGETRVVGDRSLAHV
ncbi:MAG: xanthine dehydrogenase small subunit [Geminicoccaceae bacterium]